MNVSELGLNPAIVNDQWLANGPLPMASCHTLFSQEESVHILCYTYRITQEIDYGMAKRTKWN